MQRQFIFWKVFWHFYVSDDLAESSTFKVVFRQKSVWLDDFGSFEVQQVKKLRVWDVHWDVVVEISCLSGRGELHLFNLAEFI